MAATALYADVVRVTLDSQAADAYGVQNGDGTATFKLKGGTYQVSVIASTFGTVTLQRLGPDGSTFLTAMTAFSANGVATANLARGTYKFALA
jgi:hypothetical protein